jgi:hypothetical protein
MWRRTSSFMPLKGGECFSVLYGLSRVSSPVICTATGNSFDETTEQCQPNTRPRSRAPVVANREMLATLTRKAWSDVQAFSYIS